jgi:hypothetical protein
MSAKKPRQTGPTKAKRSPPTENRAEFRASAPRKANAQEQPKAEPEKLSALDAAAKVLGEQGESMTCNELIDVMAARGYWNSPAGKTPAATLYAAIAREIATKGNQTRFAKIGRGQFVLKIRS